MPSLLVNGKSIPIVKPVVSLGASQGCDVVVPGGGVRNSHVLLFEDSGTWAFSATKGAEVRVNGRRIERGTLADGDELGLGTAKVIFRMALVATPPAPPPQQQRGVTTGSQAKALAQLAGFSTRLLAERPWGELLEELVAGLAGACGAEKAFLVAVDAGGGKRVVTGPKDEREAPALLSDTIVEKVLAAGTPLLVEDAAGSAFASAPSVVSLRIGSAIAVPLRVQGALAGAIYVGRPKGAPPFGPADLEVASAYAGLAALLLGQARHLLVLKEDVARLTQRLDQLRQGQLVGESAAMKALKDAIAKIAPKPVTVLVTGETGTGKDLVARALHRESGRTGPFVAVDCASLPEGLVEAELFGAAKGSYSGATADRPGRFEAADGGTIFLDELGELPKGSQAKLLRVLQEREVTRLGEVRTRKVDVRVVAATNRDLKAEVAAGRFREDLLFRLDEVKLSVPPLRDRGDDKLLLAELFLRQLATEQGRPELTKLSFRARQVIAGHPFPGNVRELRARLARAVALASGPEIGPDDLGIAGEDAIEPLEEAKERFVKDHVRRAVAAAGGNKKKAAEALGIGLRSIFRYLDEEG